MTRDECIKMVEVMQAFIEGKPILWRRRGLKNAIWRVARGVSPRFNSDQFEWVVKP